MASVLRYMGGLFAFALFTLAFLAAQSLQVSTTSVVLKPIALMTSFISTSNIHAIFISALLQLMAFAVPPALVAAGLAVLAADGVTYGPDRRIGAAASIGAALVGIYVLGFTRASSIVSVGLIMASLLVAGFAADRYVTAGKWKNYNSVGGAVGKALIIINVFVAIGIFFSVVSSIGTFRDLYLAESERTASAIFSVDELSDAELFALLPADVQRRYETLEPEQQAEFLQQYRELLKKSGSDASRLGNSSLGSIADLYLYGLAVTVFGIMESLRSLALIPLSGLIGVAILRRRGYGQAA